MHRRPFRLVSILGIVAVVLLAACSPPATPQAPPPPPTPIGQIDTVTRAANGDVTVAGWAGMPASTTTIPVDIYVNGKGVTRVTANLNHPAVGATQPGMGPLHGWTAWLPATFNGNGVAAAGTTITGQVCAYAINPAGTNNPQLGCRFIPGGATNVGVVVPSNEKVDLGAPATAPVNVGGISNYGPYPGSPYGCVNDGAGYSGLVNPAPVSPTQTNQCLAWNRPPTGGQRPTLVWIHGGGWIGGHALPIPAPLLGYIAAGWTVVSVQYRFASCTVNQFPTPILDVQDAVAYIKTNAVTMGVDPNKMVLFGHSAGGHIAELVGTGWNDTSGLLRSGPQYKVAGWVSLSGMSDMRYFATNSVWKNLAYQFVPSSPPLGAGCASANPANWTPTTTVLNAVSPDRQLDAQDPPGFMIHGGGDTVSPAGPSQPAMGAQQVTASRPHAVWNQVVPDDGHNPTWNPTWLTSFITQAAAGTDPAPPA